MEHTRKFRELMRSRSFRKIAIVYPASIPWMAKCLDGIRNYARAQETWHLFSSPPTLNGAAESALALRSLRGWNGDAIIAATNDEKELRWARKLGIPIVNLSGGLPKSFGIPRVMVNHFKAGQMAADHLLTRGLRNLAFFGWDNLWYSEQRQLGFSERAAEAGIRPEVFLRGPQEEANRPFPKRIAALIKWLRSLPHPTGIFAVHDYRALLLIEACHHAELRVPEDIAVIGMDNDETICEHSVPTISSVLRNSERVGWEAAALLDRMMQGEPPPERDLLLDPDGVIARQSSDKLYCTDPDVQRALDYMRLNLKAQFNIEHVAQHVGLSKRTLELRFRAHLNCSPHDFLSQLRVQRTLELIELPQKRTAAEIAAECGLSSARSLYKAVRRTTGNPLSALRSRNGS